jgi:hypothetical protein
MAARHQIRRLPGFIGFDAMGADPRAVVEVSPSLSLAHADRATDRGVSERNADPDCDGEIQ